MSAIERLQKRREMIEIIIKQRQHMLISFLEEKGEMSEAGIEKEAADLDRHLRRQLELKSDVQIQNLALMGGF